LLKYDTILCALYDRPFSSPSTLYLIVYIYLLYESVIALHPKQKFTYFHFHLVQKRVSYISLQCYKYIEYVLYTTDIPSLYHNLTLENIQHSHNNNIISIAFGIPNHMILVVSKIVQIAFHFCHLYILSH